MGMAPEAIKAALDERRFPFGVLVANLVYDFNLGSIIRTANAFLAQRISSINALSAFCEATEADVLLFDNDLSPAQTRNLEQATGVKVLDRTELIPTEPYGDFHLRMNVAVTPDGRRALVTSSGSNRVAGCPAACSDTAAGDRQLPRLLRIQDLDTGRALGYIEPDPESGIDYAQLLGRRIGVVGEKADDDTPATDR